MLLVAVLIVLSRTANLRNQLETFLIILMIPVLFVGTSFHYYLIVLLLPLSFLIAQAFDGRIVDDYSLRILVSTKVKAFAVAISLILCLLPWSVPSTLFFETTSTEGIHISASWILARIVLSLTFLLLVFTELRDKRVDLSYEN
jgi:hypothetical protein